MTVNSTINRIEYAGDGASAVFTVGFYFLIETDLKVYLRDRQDNEKLLTATTHYTVSNAGNPAGGSVKMVTAPTAGEKLVIVRDPALTQLTDYRANDAFPAETHERAIDKLTMLAQRLSERIDRSVVLRETASPGSGSYDFGGNSISNLAAPSKPAGAATKAYVDGILALVNAASGDDRFSFVPPSGVAGTANAIVLTAGRIPSSPADGYKVRFIAEAGNTAAVTLRLKDATHDWGAAALVDRELAAMTGGELKNRVPVEVTYSGAELKWVFNHGGGASVVAVRDAFTGDGAKKDFAMSAAPAAGDEISVFIDGVYQNETEWSFAGTTLTLTDAPARGAKGEIVIHNQAGPAAVPADGSVTAAKLADGAVTTAKTSGFPFTKAFVSQEQTITAGGSLNLAHGLSGTPTLLQGRLVCKTAEHGYSAGDELVIHPIGRDGTASYGIDMLPDSTNINVRFAASFLRAGHKSTNNSQNMTHANWKLVVRAWA